MIHFLPVAVNLWEVNTLTAFELELVTTKIGVPDTFSYSENAIKALAFRLAKILENHP